MTKNHTTPRPSKKLDISNVVAPAADQPIAPTAPEAPIAPTGTSVPALIVPPAAPAADLPDNSAPITVPAPVVVTPEGTAAHAFGVTISLAFARTVSNIPGFGGIAFHEPSDDELDAMIEKYMAEHEGVRMTRAAFAVKDQIDQDRAAHNAAQANGNETLVRYVRAMKGQLQEIVADMDQVIVKHGGTVAPVKTASKGTGAPRKGKTQTKWSDIAPKLIDYAVTLKLDGANEGIVYFVDVSKDGYKGTLRPVALHKDGSWTKATFNPETMALADTGISVPTYKYFDKNGDDVTDQTDSKLLLDHSMTGKDELFGIALISGGKALDLDISHDLRDEHGARKPGTLRHYALYSVFAGAAIK